MQTEKIKSCSLICVQAGKASSTGSMWVDEGLFLTATLWVIFGRFPILGYYKPRGKYKYILVLLVQVSVKENS